MKTNYWLILTLVLSTSVLAQESTNPPAAAPAPAAPKAPEPLSKGTLDKIAKNIARIIAAAPLEKKLFEKVQLRPETEKLIQNKSDIFLPANRLLIEDAYPKEVKKCQPVGWTVEDGALASVGADRGVIYTK